MTVLHVFIFLVGLLGSFIGGYLCFWLADAFFHSYLINWLFALFAFLVVMASTTFILFGDAKNLPEKRQSSKTALWPLVIGFFIGSWWSKD